MANAPFYNPTDFGCFDLAVSQVGKEMAFTWDTEVIAGAKAVITFKGKPVRIYIAGDGLTISNAERTVTLSLDGSDYDKYKNDTLTAQCSFFTIGDVEVTFSLRIVDSPL